MAKLLSNDHISDIFINLSQHVVIRIKRQNVLLEEDEFWRQIYYGNIEDEVFMEMDRVHHKVSPIAQNMRLSVNNRHKLKLNKRPDIQAEVLSSISQSNSGNASRGPSSSLDIMESSINGNSENEENTESATSLNVKRRS
ncbi:unnamed protein product [Dimorphilus gyrociliatus]|uniref:Uncharacterized protein n=1 Tax=Dimorphilus gyrociliatus TaxID=2664684 RepID=A0A7I8VGS8_9ANNE|nr:unnamed protein product [Dimorphilus gyrociliatus]